MEQQRQGRNLSGNPAENYESFFVPAIGAPVAADLIEVAALDSGEQVLDVGCGTGVVTRLAAARTGERVVGLDPNPGMLAVARSSTPAETSVEWREASAEAIPLPDGGFDVVLSQMALPFVPDKRSALREMNRVLAPGGRLALNTPGRMQALFSIMEAAVERHLSREAAGFLKVVFSMDDPGEMNELLAAGGFRDVDARTTSVTLRLPPPGEFLWQYLHSTPLIEAVRRADDDRLAALEREVVERAEHLVDEEGVTVHQELVVATGRK